MSGQEKTDLNGVNRKRQCAQKKWKPVVCTMEKTKVGTHNCRTLSHKTSGHNIYMQVYKVQEVGERKGERKQSNLLSSPFVVR